MHVYWRLILPLSSCPTPTTPLPCPYHTQWKCKWSLRIAQASHAAVVMHWPALQTHEQLRHDMSCGSSTESTDLACAVGRALTVLGRYPLILTVHFFIFLLSVHCVSVKGEVLSKPLEFISNLCSGLQQLRYHSMTLPSLTVHSRGCT